MIFEKAVLAEHPAAKEFFPIEDPQGSLVGWTFKVPYQTQSGLHLCRYGWVTVAGEVATDLLSHEEYAERNLRVYVADLTANPPKEPLGVAQSRQD